MIQSDLNSDQNMDGIAVIGMACRFPGANTLEEYWANLINKVESITRFDAKDLDPRVDPELVKNPLYIKARGILKDADKFDARFFGINPWDAEIMDPQQRVFLELAWESLEHAGYVPETYDGLIGIFAGMGNNTYFNPQISRNSDGANAISQFQAMLLNEKDYLATRVSYMLDLKGPSWSVNTGCSTSLVAVCQACDSLKAYQSDIVIAGGISIFNPQNTGYMYQEGMIASDDGHCRAFDAKANGTVFGNGAGIVVLKRLDEAIQDRDKIYAVIKGTSVNNDGSDKMSFTAPSVNGQAEVITMAMADADIDPASIAFIEAHGTGTPIGDPIEIEALTRAFRNETQEKQFCIIGSVKTNVGHLDAAAGIAGLIKTVLSLENKKIPPSLHFKSPNPSIDFANSPFYVNTELSDWPINGNPLRAGISSFGIGGTNAHVILEEAPALRHSSNQRPYQLILLSAKTGDGVANSAQNLAGYMENNPEINLSDAAYSLQIGRKHFRHRQALVCKDINNAVALLTHKDDSRLIAHGKTPEKQRDVIFMFTGQGSQYVDMAADLYGQIPEFRKIVDRCCDILTPLIGENLRDILYPGSENKEHAKALLNETRITQPALFVIEYALAKIMIANGVQPAALIGHSVGEYVAACLAGVFSYEDALKVVAERGRLMQAQHRGEMLAVMLAESEVAAILSDDLSIAAVNSPSQCVVSGPENAVNRFKEVLADHSRKENNNIQFQELKTSHAFHSAMMEPAVAPFKKVIDSVTLHPPQIPFISNVSGNWISEQQASDSAYWAGHIRHAVRFSDGISTILGDSDKIMLEIGPGTVLTSLARLNCPEGVNAATIPSIRRNDQEDADYAFLLKTFGRLWVEGVSIDWEAFTNGEPRMRIPLPTYPFERKRYWIDPVYKNMEPETRDAGADNPSEAVGIVDIKDESEIKVSTTTVPSTDIISTLTSMWIKILGYNHIQEDENYFELGGNSLMAVTLFTKIELLYGLRLPLATLYKAPTIKELAAIIRSKDYKPSWNSLVEINKGNGKSPFFCVHAEGGNVLEYRLLSKYLGENQTFYGIQAKGLEGEEIIDYSIEEMAKNYLLEVKAVQPEGPYYIGGYCLGGLVAYEMAQQLLAEGETIGALILISNATPEQLLRIKPGLTKSSLLMGRVRDRLDLELDNISVLSAMAKKLYILQRIKRTLMKIQVWSEGKLEILYRLLKTRNRRHSRLYNLQTSVGMTNIAYVKYVPKPIKTPIYLYTVNKPIRELDFDPYMGWESYAVDGIQETQVPGYHKNILKDPYVLNLAEKINVVLNECIAKQSES